MGSRRRLFNKEIRKNRYRRTAACWFTIVSALRQMLNTKEINHQHPSDKKGIIEELVVTARLCQKCGETEL